MSFSTQSEIILMSHGGGGKHSKDLIDSLFVSAFSNPALNSLGDSAVIELNGVKTAFTTDSYVINPIEFPGGDIGKLAVCGTINDLTAAGAVPLYLTAGFIIEEGLSLDLLRKITASMAKTAGKAGVKIVAGDTKVVERGSADKLFINTSGIGIIEEGLMSSTPPQEGDVVIINGTLGDHGIAVLSIRDELPLESPVISDAAPLNLLIQPLLKAFPGQIKLMRDATRGGLAVVLNELCQKKDFGFIINEKNIPVKPEVKAVCEILGFDPLYIANEGKMAITASPSHAEDIINFMKELPYGKDARIIGEVSYKYPAQVILNTGIGGGRILDMPIGEQLPRIC